MKSEHINNMCDTFEVALKTIYQYNIKNSGEIQHMEDIFHLKQHADVEKVLALLYLFSSEKEDEAVKKFSEQTGMSGMKYSAKDLVAEHKVMLLTAMVYNQFFYPMSMNFRGFVKAGLPVGLQIEENEDDELEPGDNNSRNSSFYPNHQVHRKSNLRRVVIFKPRQEVHIQTGDSPGYDMKHIGETIEITEIERIYSGDFRVFANLKTGEMELRFRCYNKKTGKAVNNVPFALKVEITVGLQKTNHFIILDQKINSFTIGSVARQFDSLGNVVLINSYEVI